MPYLTKKNLFDLLSAHKSYCEQNENYMLVNLTTKEKQDAYFTKAIVVSRYLESCKNAGFYWFNQNAPKAKAYADLYDRLKNLEELADCKGAFTKRHEAPLSDDQIDAEMRKYFKKRGAPAKIKGKRLELIKAMLERKAKREGNAKHLSFGQLAKAFGISVLTLYKIRDGKGAYK